MARFDPNMKLKSIRNETGTSVTIIGAAFDPHDRMIFEIEMGGPQNSVAAMWAVLASSKVREKGMPYIDGQVGQFKFVKPTKRIIEPLKGTYYHNWLMICEDKRFVFASDYRHQMIELTPEERQEIDAGTRQQMANRLLGSINSDMTNVAADPTWALPIYDFILDNYFPGEGKETPFRELETLGCVTQAWWLNKDFNWLGMIQTMIKQGKLTFVI